MECLCCGTCCKAFGGHLHASKLDIERWHEENREDILSHVTSYGMLWINPKTGKLLTRCPFLHEDLETHKATCDIHETKPQICRDYPTLAHERRCARGLVFN